MKLITGITTLAVFSGHTVMGATYLWNQTAAGTGYTWSTTTNWTPNGTPNEVGDVANLNNDIAGDQNVSLNQIVTIGSLNIGDATGTSIFTLAAGTGGYLVMDAATGSATINKSTGGADVISTGIQFNDTLAITNTAATSLTISGAMRSLTSDITFNGTGPITVSGGIFTAGNLVKNDTGTTTLNTTASTYAGSTTINGGTLVLNIAAAIPVRSGVTIASGATLNIQQNMTLGSLSGAGTLLNSSGNDRVITIGRDDTSTTFTGRIAPATASRVAITKIGAGTLTLAPSAASTYTGNTIINGGTLKLDFSAGTLTSMLAATPLQITGGNLEIKGRNSGSAIAQTVGALTIGATGGSIIMDPNGSALGTQLTTGAVTATAAGGALLISAPVNTSVRLGTAMNTETTVNGRIVFTANGTAYDWAANTGATTNTIALGTYMDVAGTTMAGSNTANSRIDSAVGGQTTTVATGGSITNSLKINAGASGQSLALGADGLTLTNGGLLVTGAQDYVISGSTGTLKSGTATNSDLVIHHYGSGNLTISAAIGNGIGASTLTKAGSGKLTLTGANTFTGAVFVSGGTLSFSNVAAGGAGGLGNHTASTAVTIRDGAKLQYTGITGNIAASGAGAHTYVLQGGNATVEVTESGATLGFQGAMSGAGGLTKSGPGTLLLGVSSGTSSSYSGPTIISEGVLRNATTDMLPDSSPFTILSGATLDIQSGSDTIGSISGAGTITGSATTSARTLTVGGDNTSTTFSGTFAGTAAAHVLTKSGTGVLTLNMATPSAWTGNTNITGGVLRLGASNQLNTGTQVVIGTGSGPATFDLNGFNQTVSGGNAINFYGSGATSTSNAHLTLGAGTLTLGGSVIYNNTANSQASTITATGAGGIVMTAVRTFDIRDSTAVPSNEAELLVLVNISGSGGGITKNGGGNLYLNGTNTTTGTNTFNSGTTWLDYTTNNTSKLGTGALTMGGGNLVLRGNASAATAQSTGTFTIAAGSSYVTLEPGLGQDIALNLGAIARTAGTGGGVRFMLPSGTQSATNGFTTTTANDPATGLIGPGGGAITVTDSSGMTQFATNVGGNIVGITPTVQDAIGTWNDGQHFSDSVGYSGTLDYATIVNSLRFNAAAVSTVTVANGGVLTIASGGVLQTSNATGGTSLITGGFLRSNASNELIFTTDSLSQRLEVASTLTGGAIVTKVGNGTLRLVSNADYANDYTGGTNLYGGLLQVSGGNAIGDTSTLLISANRSSVFEVLSNETIGILATSGANQTGIVSEIRLTSGDLTINDATASNRTFAGILTGSGAFIKNGASAASNLLFNSAMTSAFTGSIVVNGGLVYLEGSGTLGNASSITINKGGSFLFSNNGSTRNGDRVLNTMPITLNSADGSWNTESIVSGLSLRTDQNTSSSTSEQFGQLNIASGANYVRVQSQGGDSSRAFLTASNFVRTNAATLDVRGRALGSNSATGGQSQLKIVDGADETAFMATLVGGVDYTAGADNVKIAPWAIGENVTGGGIGATNMGNSLVTYIDNRGFYALDLTNDYSTYSAAATPQDNIRESLTTNLTGLTGKTINAFVIHNNNTTASNINVTGTGAGQTLNLNAGTLLFTANPAAAANAAMGINLGGFDAGITVGSTNEYVIFVVNPSGAADTAVVTATISSPLSSVADITKSGRGTLILTSNNTAGGGITRKTTLNEGVLEISDLENIGGNTGGLVFAGGTLRLGSGFADDLSTRAVSFLTGGGILDTNGNNVSFAGAFGSGTGSFTKIGAGTVTMAGTAGYTGSTSVQNGKLILNGGASDRLSTSAPLVVGGGTTSGVVQLGDATNGASNQTVSSLATSGTGTANAIIGGGPTASILTVNQSTTTAYAGSIGGAGTNENHLGLTKSGIGALTLSGSTLTFTGPLSVTGGTLNITGSPGAALTPSAVTVGANATLNFVNGVGQAINLGSGVINLGAGTGTTILGFELGSTSAYDSINSTAAAVTTGSVLFNFTGLSGLGVGSYDLLTAAGGLDGATYTIGSFTNPVAGIAYSLTRSATFVRLNAGTTAAGDLYWRGGVSSSWSGFNGNLDSNFTTDAAGTINAKGTPGATNRVIFSATSAPGSSITTTLDGNYTIQDLHFTAAPSGVTSVGIAPGNPTTSSLTITPSVATDGIDVAANAGAVSISAPFVIGAAQTWHVDGTGANGSSLTIAGAVSGGLPNSTQAAPGSNISLTITGSGAVTLGSTANTFTGDILVDGATYNVDSDRDWGGATVASSTSHMIILQNGAKLRVTSGTVNPGAATTTNYNLVRVDTGGATFETLSGATLQLDDSGQLTGTGDLTKTGLGTLILRNQTLFTGALLISQGTLQTTGGTGGFGTTDAGTTIASGAALNLNGQTVTDTETVTIFGTGLAASPAGAITNLAAANASFAGPVIMGSNATIGTSSTGNLTLSSNFTGNGFDLTVRNTGGATTTLSGTTISHTGSTTVLSGGLNFAGNAGSALGTSAITVAGGASLGFVNGAGWQVNLGTGLLNVGGGTGASGLGFELGSLSNYDSIATSSGAIMANSVLLNLTGLTGMQAGSYDVITAPSGLDNATYSFGTLTSVGGFSFAISSSPTVVRVITTALATDLYWRGGVSNSWSTFSPTLDTNFTTDLAGNVNAKGTPGAANRVIFSANGAASPAISTTLDSNITISDLEFIANPSGVTSVTIAAGTPATNRLTITPSVATDGIRVADNAGAVTISAPVTLGANQTWEVVGTGANGSSLSVSGGINGTADLTKSGDGTLTLTGTNTYAGTTTVAGGVLQAGVANGFNQTSTHVVNAGGILRLNNFAAAIGALAGAGIVENGSTGTAARVLTMGGNNASTTFSGTMRDGGSFGLSVTKTGTGTFTFTGSDSRTGPTIIAGGAYVAAGTSTATGSITVANGTTPAVLNVTGAMTGSTLTVGTAANSVGAVNIKGGSLVMATPETTDTISFGAANGGYGAFTMSSGTFTQARFMFGGTSATSGTGGIGVGLITGGTVNTNGYIILARHGASAGILTITNGTINHAAAAQNINLGWQGSGRAEFNIAGGLVDNTGRNVVFGGSSWTGTGILNLNAGTLLTNAMSETSGTSYVNFNGGTLKAAAASTAFIATSIDAVYVNGAFGTYAGGAVIDTNGFNSTIGANLITPTGDGVRNLSLGSGGSGYIGAPQVVITGDGTGATGYAVVDTDPLSATFGQVISIVITNPGVNYTTANVTFNGGGGTGASATVTLGANTSGGLTKVGAGTLTLSGANTYTGGTTVNAGTLALGANNVLSDAGAVTISGGTFDVATFNDTVGTVTLNSGTITGTTGVLSSNASFELHSGTVNGILSGSAGINKTTAGVVTVNSANTFSGAVTVNAGELAFSTSANLGDASATNTVNLNGGTLHYTGTGALDLTSTRVLRTGGSGGTIDVSSLTGSLTFSGGVNPTSTGNLTKVGGGTLILSGTTNLNGAAVNVSEGTLRASFGTNGIGALSIGATGFMDLRNGAAESLTLSSNPGSLTLVDGARIGFDLGAAGTPGASDRLITLGSATVGGTITFDFTNLSGFGAGTYNLISAASGLNAGTYVVGTAPAGYNYIISKTDTLVSLSVVAFVPRYWTNSQGTGSWATLNAGQSNWSTDAAGAVNSTDTPAANHTVIFSASSAPFTSGSQIDTTLNGNYTIDSLQFISAPSGVTAVNIAQGTTGTLTIAPVSTIGGISVGDNAGNVTISAPVVASNVNVPLQTWFVSGLGNSLAVTGNVAFNAGVNKTGAGTLTLSGNNSGAGGVTLTGGRLNINSATALGTGEFTIGDGTTIDNTTAAAITLSTNNIQAWGGAFTFLGTQSLNLGTGSVTLLNNSIVTVSAQTLTVGGAIGDGGNNRSLTKNGTGTLVLGGANTFEGGLTLNEGALHINNASALGTGTFTINGGTIDNSSGAAIVSTTNNAQVWNSNFTFTGTRSLNLGTGAVSLGTAAGTTRAVTVAANNLTVGGPIANGTTANSLTKTGAGTLTLTGMSATAANNYSGLTTIDQGTVVLTGTSAFTGGLTFGNTNTTTTTGSLDLSNGSATFAGALTVQTNIATANTIAIGAGRTMTVNGNVVIGSSAAANTTTALTVSGAGAFNVTNTAASGAFTVGGTSAAANAGNVAVADFSGLASMNINLSGASSVITVNPNISNASNNASNLDATLRLASTSVLTAATLNVGAGPTHNASGGQRNELYLGSTSTQINATTINVGTGARDIGFIGFAGSTGSVIIRAQNGTGRANFNMGTGTASTGVAGGSSAATSNVVDFTGHDADLLFGTVTIGGQNRNAARWDTFSFNQGTFDATTVVVGDNGGTANTTAVNSTWTSTLNLGGGTVVIGTGGLDIGKGDTTVTGTDTLAGVVNITGGTVTIANSAGLGAAIRMAHNTTTGAGLTTNASLNISGTASVTVSGHIIKGSSTAPGSATVTLNGGTLNLTGNEIGAAGSLVTLNAQAGTLMNLAQYNGGAGLVKTTTGTLILEGSNTYSGGTTISGGILQVGTGGTTGTLGSGTVTNNATLTVNRSNTYAINDNITGSGNVIQAGSGTTSLGGANDYTGGTAINDGTLEVNSASALGTTGNITFGGGALQYTLNNTADYSPRIKNSTASVKINTNGQNVTYASAVDSTNTGGLTKQGAGSLKLTASNTYSGPTIISGGSVIAANATALSTGDVTVAPGGTLTVGDPGTRQALQLGGSLISTGTLAFDIFAHTTGANATINNDFITLTSLDSLDSISLTGTLSVATTLDSTLWQKGDSWTLLDWSMFLGSTIAATPTYTGFSMLDLPALAAGLDWNVFVTSTGLGISVVPEPSRAMLLLLGLAALVMRRRRKSALGI